VGKAEGRRPLGRPNLRWEGIVKMVLQEVDGAWTGLMVAQVRDSWQVVVNAVMNLQVS